MALTVSHRCQNIAPSMTLSIDARAKEMKAAGLNVIGFGAGEPDFPTPQHICDAAKEAIDLGMTRYTPAAGTKELRKAICEKLRRDNDMTYTYGDILVSNGAKHSLFNIFQAILDPGDEVLIPTPCWGRAGVHPRHGGDQLHPHQQGHRQPGYPPDQGHRHHQPLQPQRQRVGAGAAAIRGRPGGEPPLLCGQRRDL